MNSALATDASTQEAPAGRFIHVIQGEYAVADTPGAVLTTLLGSCVAACIRDPASGVGGMNHFLLPGDSAGGGASLKYGVNAMELLINALLQRGAVRRRLEAKLFGGAHVIANLSDVGRSNAAFAAEFLRTESIPCVGQSLGGDQARRIRFWPATGRVSQLLLEASQTDVFKAEVAKQAPIKPTTGDVELF